MLLSNGTTINASRIDNKRNTHQCAFKRIRPRTLHSREALAKPVPDSSGPPSTHSGRTLGRSMDVPPSFSCPRSGRERLEPLQLGRFGRLRSEPLFAARDPIERGVLYFEQTGFLAGSTPLLFCSTRHPGRDRALTDVSRLWDVLMLKYVKYALACLTVFDNASEGKEGRRREPEASRREPEDARIALRCTLKELRLVDSFVASNEYPTRSEL